MNAQNVDMFIMSNGKYFDSSKIGAIRNRLIEIEDSRWNMIQVLQFKDTTTSIVVSLLAGSLGIDRFLIGDTGLGIAKLLTCGGFGLWTIVDWFMIMGATKEKNFQKLSQVLY